MKRHPKYGVAEVRKEGGTEQGSQSKCFQSSRNKNKSSGEEGNLKSVCPISSSQSKKKLQYC